MDLPRVLDEAANSLNALLGSLLHGHVTTPIELDVINRTASVT